jgi:hypothetical protein
MPRPNAANEIAPRMPRAVNNEARQHLLMPMQPLLLVLQQTNVRYTVAEHGTPCDNDPHLLLINDSSQAFDRY